MQRSSAEPLLVEKTGFAGCIVEWGSGVSKNYFLQFVIKSAKVDDAMALRRKDNHGDMHSDEVAVS